MTGDAVRKQRVTPRKTTAVDATVGQQLRKRRRMLNISQAELAEAIGVAPQQVQKYEAGTNRLSVSRLVQIADVLDAPVGWFFREIDVAGLAQPTPSDDEAFLALLSTLAQSADRAKVKALAELLCSGMARALRVRPGRTRRTFGRQFHRPQPGQDVKT